jgi:tartrate dehydrogenase/decarboxylase / D-malate dehydrogenase
MKMIAVIPGDGIGKEVVPVAMRVLDAAGRKFGFTLKWNVLPWSCEFYQAHGRMMPENGLDVLRGHDAIYLGAVGDPAVPDAQSLWGLLIPIRRTFQQYANVRPIRLLRGIRAPLANLKPGDIDLCVVRENNEGEYSSVGGRAYEGTDLEMALQETIFTRRGVERIIRFAFRLAQKRKKHVSSATKSNGIIHTMPFWDEVFWSVAKEYPDVKADQYHVDNMAAQFVLNPQRFDVVVASNLFGDILSDLGPAIAGSLGIAPSANLNPEGEFPSLFEPVHGSAPDIAGKGIANPVGQIWSGAMMLDHLGYAEAGRAIEKAIEAVIGEKKVTTSDLGGSAKTDEVGAAVIDLLQA